jgi:Phage integrase family
MRLGDGDGGWHRASRAGQKLEGGERLSVELRVLEREEAFACSRAKPTDHVFASEAGTPLGFRTIVRRWLEAALREAGLDRRVRRHDLRHCFASLLISEEATVGCVSRRLGHMSLRRERVLVLAVILALLGAGCGSGGQLGAKALSQQSKSLRSDAAEGALLAQDAVSGKTTRVYTREHSSELYKAASQAEASLKAAKTEPALRPKLRRLAALAARVSVALKRLGGASKDQQRALGRELERAARESEKIGQGLK